MVYTANGDDLIIDLLAAFVGFDGCYGATSVDNGSFELRKRSVGKGKKNVVSMTIHKLMPSRDSHP